MMKKRYSRIGSLTLAALLCLPTGLAYGLDSGQNLGEAPREIAQGAEQQVQQLQQELRLLQQQLQAYVKQNNISRGMFTMALGQIEGTEGVLSQQFTDVTPAMDYAKYIGWAMENKLVNGKSPGRFEPDEPLSRQEMATILTNYARFKGRDVSNIEGMAIENFSDYAQIAPWALSSVRYCLSTGLLPGKSPDFYDPQGPVTHVEATWVLGRLTQLPAPPISRVMTIPSFDGYALEGKLDLPAGDKVDKLVIFVNGSGPNTYDNHREGQGMNFNYFDLFADQLTSRNIGFFRYSTRGVKPHGQGPLFAEIDEGAYQTYLPGNSVQDIEAMVQFLKKDGRLKDAKIYLLGWSEGTMIAPKVAQRNKVQVDGLLLAGYCNDSMDQILDWQHSGASSMIFYGQCFDYDQNGSISKAEFTEDRYKVQSLLKITFEELDKTGDQKLDNQDFAIVLAPFKADLRKAIEVKDDQWLKENYPVRLTSAWFKAHGQWVPNRETLPTLNLPIHIFHGTADQNVSVQGVNEIESSFKKLGKTNLTTHIYQNFNHDLNYLDYIQNGQLPKSFQDLFKVCEAL